MNRPAAPQTGAWLNRGTRPVATASPTVPGAVECRRLSGSYSNNTPRAPLGWRANDGERIVRDERVHRALSRDDTEVLLSLLTKWRWKLPATTGRWVQVMVRILQTRLTPAAESSSTPAMPMSNWCTRGCSVSLDGHVAGASDRVAPTLHPRPRGLTQCASKVEMQAEKAPSPLRGAGRRGLPDAAPDQLTGPMPNSAIQFVYRERTTCARSSPPFRRASCSLGSTRLR